MNNRIGLDRKCVLQTETVASRNVVDLLLHEFGSGICDPKLSGPKGSDSENFALRDWSSPTIFKFESECPREMKFRYVLAPELILTHK